MQAFKDLGFLESVDSIKLEDWRSFTRTALQQRTNTTIPSDDRSLYAAVYERVGADHIGSVWEALEKLGLVPSAAPTVSTMPSVPPVTLPPIDLLAAHLAHMLRYSAGERDLVVLAHEVIARTSDGTGVEVHTSKLMVYGDEHASAMARTVGLPVALATREVLKGSVSARGVCGPTAQAAEAVWKGVLNGLEQAGIGMREETHLIRGTKAGGMVDTLVKGLKSSDSLSA
jgi:alpha-aminoadipic semialdehyde synthase